MDAAKYRPERWHQPPAEQRHTVVTESVLEGHLKRDRNGSLPRILTSSAFPGWRNSVILESVRLPCACSCVGLYEKGTTPIHFPEHSPSSLKFRKGKRVVPTVSCDSHAIEVRVWFPGSLWTQQIAVVRGWDTIQVLPHTKPDKRPLAHTVVV